MTPTWPMWGALGGGLVSTELTPEPQTTEVRVEFAARILPDGSPAAGLKGDPASKDRIFRK